MALKRRAAVNEIVCTIRVDSRRSLWPQNLVLDANTCLLSPPHSWFAFPAFYLRLHLAAEVQKPKVYAPPRRPVVKGRKNTRKLLFVIVAISSPSFHPATVFPLTHLLLSNMIDPKLKGTEKL